MLATILDSRNQWVFGYVGYDLATLIRGVRYPRTLHAQALRPVRFDASAEPTAGLRAVDSPWITLHGQRSQIVAIYP